MPLFLEQETLNRGMLGLWRIREPESYFLQRLNLSEDEEWSLLQIKGEGRRIQWLAARCLLHHLLGSKERLQMLKDEFGKPYIPDSKLYISISHSHDMAAALISPVSCGVDIQFPVEKIRRLVPRFCSKKELDSTEKKHGFQTMHIIWGAKECIYKAHGRREVDYRKDIMIESPHKLIKRPGIGELKNKKTRTKYDIFAEVVLNYILTYCFQSREESKIT